MEKLRVGVIGTGYLGKFHAEKYAAMDEAVLVGVVDIDAVKAKAVAEHVGTQAFTDYQDLMGKVDAVSVVTTTTDHFEVSRDFLSWGVDVLIEKPMTTTVQEADELIRLARARNRIIQVGHLERFNPAVIALLEVVEKPMFIEAHRLSLYKARCTDVSVVLDLMIHDIDIILSVVGSPLKQIHATGVPVISGQVDIANARLEFESGCVANVTTSRISTKNQRKFRLFQRDTYISVDFADREIMVIRNTGAQGAGPIPGMEIDHRRFDQGDALDDELRSFVKAVQEGRTSQIPGESGREALTVALDIMDQIQASCSQYWE